MVTGQRDGGGLIDGWVRPTSPSRGPRPLVPQRMGIGESLGNERASWSHDSDAGSTPSPSRLRSATSAGYAIHIT